MITESKVVIINSSGKMIPLGRINIGVLHSKILSDYLKETYPDVLAFQDFKVEIENISYEKANTTLERFLKLDTLNKTRKLSK